MIPDRERIETGEQRRQYYRIIYPMRERPRLRICDLYYEVIDLSERGVKFKLAKKEPLLLAHGVEATISRVGSVVATLTGDVALVPISSFFLIPQAPDSLDRPIKDGGTPLGRATLRLWNHDYQITRFHDNRIAFRDPERGFLARIPDLRAEVTFFDQQVNEIEGCLVRVGEGYAALRLSAGIPCRTIYAEQLRLMKTYAGFA